MLVTVVEVPNIWSIKVYGLLNQPQPQNLGVEIYVALWIARDGDAKNISRFLQAPILLATFIAGPFGLLVWLGVREPAARRQGRFR